MDEIDVTTEVIVPLENKLSQRDEVGRLKKKAEQKVILDALWEKRATAYKKLMEAANPEIQYCKEDYFKAIDEYKKKYAEFGW